MVEKVRGTLVVVGILVIAGTAGASDADLITMSQIIVRCAIGLGLMAGGVFIGK